MAAGGRAGEEGRIRWGQTGSAQQAGGQAKCANPAAQVTPFLRPHTNHHHSDEAHSHGDAARTSKARQWAARAACLQPAAGPRHAHAHPASTSTARYAVRGRAQPPKAQEPGGVHMRPYRLPSYKLSALLNALKPLNPSPLVYQYEGTVRHAVRAGGISISISTRVGGGGKQKQGVMHSNEVNWHH